ncbi:hypothetical protein J7I93_04245 [Bacillus sp. ISL-47]|uniref:hypothetical protein n=1 Tax=Bacillus sp. ISL-47 TaxID=2819130 RepID=UPI001BEC3EFE|nr:hypothetical protein [Bacillus sp. ISL-47]MBT2687388.1 hypothetical protein [Bacillus sp. ISL-47]MBT2707150.1 hypothetical protein [Pseudomonas sp. ISL-84]
MSLLLSAFAVVVLNPISILLILGLLIYYRKFYILGGFLAGILLPVALFLTTLTEDAASGLLLVMMVPPGVVVGVLLGFVIQRAVDKKRGTVQRGAKAIKYGLIAIFTLMIGFMAVLYIHEMYSNHKYEQSIEEKKYELRKQFEEEFREKAFDMGMKNDTYVLGFESGITIADYEDYDGLFAEGTLFFKTRGDKTHTEEAFQSFKSEMIQEFNRMKGRNTYQNLKLNDWAENNINIKLAN